MDAKSKGKKRDRGEGTPSPKGKGKRRQRSPDMDIEEISNPRTIIGEEEHWAEYDDQAWVAAANSIVAELARTNGLLERSIVAAESSRAAMEWSSDAMVRFVEEQRAFQALLLESVRGGSGGPA